MNPPPPIPHDCGRATFSAKMIDAAASTAFPPWSSTPLPIAEAAGDSVATIPPVLRVAGRYLEPSFAGAAAAIAKHAVAAATHPHAARMGPDATPIRLRACR